MGMNNFAERMRTMKKKILFIINQFYRGGAETIVLNCLNAIKNDYIIDFIVYDHVERDSYCSLLPYIPKGVNLLVCNGSKNKHFFSFIPNIISSFFKKEAIGDIRLSKKIKQFTNGKTYDLALNCGEWVSLDVLAFGCKALKKSVWIQGDIKKSSLDKENFFRYEQYIDSFIFVSKPFLKSVLSSYPFLASKAQILDNLLNYEEIFEKSKEDKFKLDPNQLNLISLGNIRTEKGYELAIKTASLLVRKKINFSWRIVGAPSNINLYRKLQKLILEEKLESRVFLIGPLENPYPLLRNSDILVSTSDHESWSLVISEAIFLKTPVVATKTVGALAQITNGELGLLVDRNPQEFADGILKLGKKSFKNLCPTYRNNVSNFKKQFELVISEKKPKSEILFVIDDINYLGGAHLATLNLARNLNKTYSVDVFSGVPPKLATRLKLETLRIFSPFLSQFDRAKKEKFLTVLASKEYSKYVKAKRFLFSLKRKFTGYQEKEENSVSDGYKVVYVMSEGSRFRSSIAKLECYKIQAIHTNYFTWSQLNTYTKHLTKDDERIYKEYDKIICVSERGATGIKYLYPFLSEKVITLPNLLQNLPNSKTPPSSDGIFRILTVARLEAEKDIPRMLRIAKRLKEDGLNFRWTFIGGGLLFKELKSLSNSLKLENNIEILGSLPRPFSQLSSVDLFALLSHYEGLPNTIYESFAAGIPVIATYPAGREQVISGVNGFLVEDDEISIYSQLKHIISEPAELNNLRKKLSTFHYDNASILERYNDVFLEAITRNSK